MRTLYRTLIGATLAVPVILLAQSKPAAPAIDDAAIVGIFDIANTWDIATGTLASTKAASKEVKDFGTMLARDHKVVQDSGRALAAKLKVTPTPVAAPLMAAITGLRDRKIRNASTPPPSRGTRPALWASVRVWSNVAPPAERSAPAQNARPSPVTMTARTESSASAKSKAEIISRIIVSVKAFSFSGRESVNVAIDPATEYEICEKLATPRR